MKKYYEAYEDRYKTAHEKRSQLVQQPVHAHCPGNDPEVYL